MDHHEFTLLTVGGASVGGEPVGWASAVGGGIGLGSGVCLRRQMRQLLVVSEEKWLEVSSLHKQEKV
jgi:hypothetical protein